MKSEDGRLIALLAPHRVGDRPTVRPPDPTRDTHSLWDLNRSTLERGGAASLPPDSLGCRALVGSSRNSSLRASRLIEEGRQPIVWRFAVSPHDAPPGAARGETLAQISTGLVQLHSRYYGKGPTKAKTHQVNDTVVSILRGGFTRVERTLIDTGEVESVYQMRRSFQQAMEDQFRQIVEDATGRNVIAYMSSINIDPDLAVELFVLEPLEGGPEGDHVPGSDGAGADGNADSA
jgi:uncharacterized protein YbcI